MYKSYYFGQNFHGHFTTRRTGIRTYREHARHGNVVDVVARPFCQWARLPIARDSGVNKSRINCTQSIGAQFQVVQDMRPKWIKKNICLHDACSMYIEKKTNIRQSISHLGRKLFYNFNAIRTLQIYCN